MIKLTRLDGTDLSSAKLDKQTRLVESGGSELLYNRASQLAGPNWELTATN